MEGERLFAFPDNICPPEVGARVVNKSRDRHPFRDTKLSNAEGRKPGVADALTKVAQKVKPEAVVWRGDLSLPTSEQGLKVLGVPVGHPECIVRELAQKAEEKSLLSEHIPLVEDVQATWRLLTLCAVKRANFWLRTVPREFTQDHAKYTTGA